MKVGIFSPYPVVAEVLRVCLDELLWKEYCWNERLKGEVFNSNSPRCALRWLLSKGRKVLHCKEQVAEPM